MNSNALRIMLTYIYNIYINNIYNIYINNNIQYKIIYKTIYAKPTKTKIYIYKNSLVFVYTHIELIVSISY